MKENETTENVIFTKDRHSQLRSIAQELHISVAEVAHHIVVHQLDTLGNEGGREALIDAVSVEGALQHANENNG